MKITKAIDYYQTHRQQQTVSKATETVASTDKNVLKKLKQVN